MKKDEERLKAAQYTTAIISFNQSADNCTGYVAWWLRRALQGKEFWKLTHFEDLTRGLPNDFQRLGMSRWCLYDDDDIKGLSLSLQAKARKAEQLHNAFGDPQTRHQRSAAYVTKNDLADRFSGELVNISAIVGAQDNTDGFDKTVNALIQGKCVAHLSFDVGGETHAIGLNCQDPVAIRYFDPNLGEFFFKNSTGLLSWWKECYNKREVDGKGAFALFQHSFRYNYFIKR